MSEENNIKESTVWSCKIGVIGDLRVPSGADLPMRQAVQREFNRLTGVWCDATFSGWGDGFTESEMRIIEPGIERDTAPDLEMKDGKVGMSTENKASLTFGEWSSKVETHMREIGVNVADFFSLRGYSILDGYYHSYISYTVVGELFAQAISHNQQAAVPPLVFEDVTPWLGMRDEQLTPEEIDASIKAANAELQQSVVVPHETGTEPLNRQVGGSHYLDMPIQPIEVMRLVLTEEEYRGYLKGSVIKYSMRAGHKPNSDDAGKAQHYREFLMEVLQP